MAQQSDEEWIVQQLGRGEKPADLIARVCERTGLLWDDARQLIEKVQAEHTTAIRSGRRRIAVLIGMPVICGGVYLVVISTFAICFNTVRIRFTDVTHPIVYIALVAGFLIISGAIYGMIRWKD